MIVSSISQLYKTSKVKAKNKLPKSLILRYFLESLIAKWLLYAVSYPGTLSGNEGLVNVYFPNYLKLAVILKL